MYRDLSFGRWDLKPIAAAPSQKLNTYKQIGRMRGLEFINKRFLENKEENTLSTKEKK